MLRQGWNEGWGLWLAALLFAGMTSGVAAAEEQKLPGCYELRIYYAPLGKLDALHARFKNHTLKLFEKHGMTNVGYWVPVENPDRMLVYVLAFPSLEAREKSWKDFMADPDWQAAHKESEKEGTLVAKIESKLMVLTDYSPQPKPVAEGERVFELRTYTASKGNLKLLNGRFREHTMKLFEKHGMTNVIYWNLAPEQEGAEDTLIYLLAHKSQEAAAASFASFRDDKDWTAARDASEKAGGGSLTAPEGVKSLFLVPTEYSPLK